MKNEIDLSVLKCKQCKTQIKFKYHENVQYSCTNFCNKFKKNWCNKSLIVLFLVFVALVAVGVILSEHRAVEGKKYYGLLAAETILCLMFLAMIIIFIQANLVYK
jgi:hypothetical protein